MPPSLGVVELVSQEPLVEDDPDGGVAGAFPPGWPALPMSGQLCVEPDPVLPEEPVLPELEFEFVPDPEVGDVVLVLEEPVSPGVELLELVPELPVVEVVAALATSAPPVTSPAESALTASTLRRRIFIG